jgi:hypothetical protein
MKTSCTALLCLVLAAPALAQDNAATTETRSPSASELDLSVPKETVHYRSDPSYSSDPPGTFYGDKSGRPLKPADVAPEALVAREQCEGKLHGSVSTGFGYASHGGNSNWQAVNVNSCKTYYDDDGNPRTIGVSISVGRSDGPDYYHRGPRGYGPAPGW